MGRVAALDFGLKRIGIALSDRDRKIALPLQTVDGGKQAVLQIAKALPMKEIDLILIGLPLLMDGKKGEMAEIVEKFAQKVEQELGVPTLLWDERLSSRQADAMLRETDSKRKQREEKKDMVAATLLLQSYLDKR
jgi:putative Holliday junction resolvase